ncbi:MAG TPA: hypothetical protein VFE58_03085 [Tepidisphaeraceae bacterium]|jgi:hypothetical protein|nr:hypothetical protein [Tepidisphaeraceae bacterium]
MPNPITIRIAGNSLHCRHLTFDDTVTVGQILDKIGVLPRKDFRPSHTLVIRRWHNAKPYSFTLPLTEITSRDFPLRDKDLLIYQYNLE